MCMAYWTLCGDCVVVSNEEKYFIQMTETEQIIDQQFLQLSH